MKHYLLISFFLILSSNLVLAQTPESLEQFYKSQQDAIQTSKITYFKIKTIPPLVLRGGMDRVQEREEWIADQLEMFPKVRESGNYDPEKEKAVLESIEAFQKEMYEPRIYHQEVTYITTPEKRCQIIKKLSPGEPFEQTKVYDGEKSFLYVPHLDELHSISNSVWLNPKEGTCLFGADIGWRLEHGYTIAKEDGFYQLIDSDGNESASFLIDPANQNAWTQMTFSQGNYVIAASDFQMENGIPIPKIVTVHRKVSDGSLYEIERMELIEAEINGVIDDEVFQTPQTEEESSRLAKRIEN